MRLYAFKSLGKGFGVGTSIGRRRTRKASGGGCLGIIIIALFGLGYWVYTEAPWLVGGVVGGVLLVGLLYALIPGPTETTNCEICGNPLGEKQGVVTVRGEAKTVCSHCLGAVKRKMSSRAVSALFKDDVPETTAEGESPEPMLRCPHCAGEIPATNLKAGLTFECPNCHKMVQAAERE